ncbi:hypothetical protein DFH07DRAFT_1055189 [Mycena maculata]|uniref:Uncharacterized protein n=1 Tax=Mycena maculata TaxID=230809 RepID=A0AAD7KBQ2_9AGAR|nr:hypothetical protein DFH07DRAFT_1055189 [Mycena maculata]
MERRLDPNLTDTGETPVVATGAMKNKETQFYAPLSPDNSRLPPMSQRHRGITEKKFWRLPALGPTIPSVTQARASDDVSAATTSRSSQKPSQALPRTEGCFVTGFTDLSSEFAHFVSAFRAKDRLSEERKILHLMFELKVIPTIASPGFSLEHPSNMAWLSIVLHKHHDNWATIAISPCLADMVALTEWYETDNANRQCQYLVPLTQLQNKYQLTVLHPKHFHPHPQQSISVLGADGCSKPYRASPDGVLKDEHDVPLPPFALSRNTSTCLNPILVNFAAALRLRRLQRMDPALLQNFSTDTLAVIGASLKLYEAVMWTPVLSGGPQESGDEDGASSLSNMFETLGRDQAMDVLLGGYDFEPLLELIDDTENGGPSPPRPMTPPNDEETAEVPSSEGPESALIPMTGPLVAGAAEGAAVGHLS